MEQSQVPMIMNLTLSVDEAQMILTKLNTSDFRGFNEASLAMTLFTKIKSAKAIPMQVGPGPIGQVKTMTAPTMAGQAVDTPAVKPQSVLGEPARKFAPPVTQENLPVEEEERIKDEIPEDGPDDRPVAPLMAVNTNPKQVFSEDPDTNDLVFESDGDVTTDEDLGFKEVEPVVEDGKIKPVDVPDIVEEDKPFTVVTGSAIVEHPDPESTPPVEENSEVSKYI